MFVKNALIIGVVLFLAMPVFAEDRASTVGNVYQSATGSTKGEATGEGEATFTMSFTGKAKTQGDMQARGVTNNDGGASGYVVDK